MRYSVFDYKFKSFSVHRSFSDAMYTWEMEVAEGYDTPPTHEPIEAIKWVNNKKYCLLVGFPITSQSKRSDSEHGTVMSGYSYGWKVPQRPILQEDRLLKSTVQGNRIIIEDPLLYLSRLIHSTDNPCGLLKGGWDSKVEKWGSIDLPYQQFEASDSSNVMNQVDDICEYAGLFYMDGWKEINGIFQPVTYLRSETALDTGYDLPDPILITANSDDVRTQRVMVDAESEINGDKWFNSVWVDGVIQGETSGVTRHKPEKWVVADMGLERPYPYNFTLPPMTRAEVIKKVVEKCNYLYDLVTIPAETFSVKFFDRYDLKLMQKIRFSGFSTIPDMQMRITEIEYTINADEGCICTCTCASDRSWSAMRKLALSLKRDWAAVSDSIKRSIESKMQQVTYGRVVAVNGSTVIMEDPKTGAHSYVNLPNQG